MRSENFAPSFAVIDVGAHVTSDHVHCFAFVGDQLLVRTSRTNPLPDPQSLNSLGAPHSIFNIGTLGEQTCQVRAWPQDTTAPDGFDIRNLRSLWSVLPDELFFVAMRAKHLLGWDMQSRFCGVCGNITSASPGETAKRCPNCGQRDYPRIAPAVMILVHRGDELLLARSPHFAPGVYSALAGFVEAGESVETCAQREVLEEVGLHICNLRWFASQPWPFPNSLMLAFHAEYTSGEIVPQPGEIEDAQWFHIDALPGLPSSLSIASRLIADGIAEIRAAHGNVAGESA